MKRRFTLLGWVLLAASLPALITTNGYGKDLYEASLTGAYLNSYEREVDAKISIDDEGKVELKISGLKSYPDNKFITQNSTLVIETEVNDNPKTFSESFEIISGYAHETFTLEGLNKNDKLEIINVAIKKETSPDATPTVTASPTATSSPVETPTTIASPTPVSSPTETPSVTPSSSPAESSMLASILNSSTDTDDVILVPGGLMSKSTTATSTPVASPSPTPEASPTSGIIDVEDVEIKPETINLRSHGKFKAFIELPSPYSVNDIVEDSVECEGARAIDGKVANERFIATFNVQDLDLGLNLKFRKHHGDKRISKELTVSGELSDGSKFEGKDKIRIMNKGKRHDDDDDDDDD